jgi:hypothetical protein
MEVKEVKIQKSPIDLENIKIQESPIDLENGDKGKVAIFIYKGEKNPLKTLAYAISRYVGYQPFTQFIDIEMDNPYVRVIVFGINEMKQEDFREVEDVKIQESPIDLINGDKGKVAIFMYQGEDDPMDALDQAAHKYIENKSFMQFIDIEMDNPCVRVIVSGINKMKQETFDPLKHRLCQ